MITHSETAIFLRNSETAIFYGYDGNGRSHGSPRTREYSSLNMNKANFNISDKLQQQCIAMIRYCKQLLSALGNMYWPTMHNELYVTLKHRRTAKETLRNKLKIKPGKRR